MTDTDLDSLFISGRDAARYLGISYSSLMHSDCGTECLGEYRRNLGKRIVYFREQVEEHGARVAARGKCDGACEATAKRLIEQARSKIAGNVASNMGKGKHD